MIDSIAKWIVTNGYEDYAEVILQGVMPGAAVGGTLLYMGIFPLLPLLGNEGMNFGNLLINNPIDNVQRILAKVQELRKIKEELKAKLPKEQMKQSKFSSLRRLFSRK